MPTAMTFPKVQTYLDAILGHAIGDDISLSPHKQFWRTMNYQQFTTGNVPNQMCQGQPIKIINDADPTRSPFFLILQGGWCNKRQMPPDDDPKIKDLAYHVTLPDGTAISGQSMLDDIESWLKNGFPE